MLAIDQQVRHLVLGDRARDRIRAGVLIGGPFRGRDLDPLPAGLPEHLARVPREDHTRPVTVMNKPIAGGIKTRADLLRGLWLVRRSLRKPNTAGIAQAAGSPQSGERGKARASNTAFLPEEQMVPRALRDRQRAGTGPVESEIDLPP